MISVVIPTYNESACLVATIGALRKYDPQQLLKEIIVADGGSQDNTTALARAAGVRVVDCPQKGRAAQMNFGAAQATQPILYFLHADTIPPPQFTLHMQQKINQGYQAGCYRLAFDQSHWFLQVNAWFTRFNVNAFRFGDQSLFVTREKWQEVGGFCEKHWVLEDQHLITRLKKIAAFTIIPKPVITSARKYRDNGIYKTQGIFFLIYFMYQLGISQQKLVRTYGKLIRHHKL